MEPQTRSALLNLSRAVKSLSQEQRSRPLASESNVARGFSAKSFLGPSQGGKATVVTFGLAVDRPTTQRLLERGAGAFVYVAQDTDTVYIWNGREYKSAVFT